MVAAAPRLEDPERVQILHQTGAAHEGWVREGVARLGRPVYVAVGYIEDVADAYACADLVVCRAGASTLAEVTACGLPGIVVPYPHATEGHQDANAGLLADAGAAILLPDRELSGERVAGLINRLRADPPALQAMAAASRSLGRPDAAAQVAALVVAAAGKESM
jgi:UDP-N-acetylglucosamine--N-acetylmuramyl-(pentapeptide) pyrophosphoryl-undecaprenol N-acetylglucosamine transferase